MKKDHLDRQVAALDVDRPILVVALMGGTGVGKSTLMNALAGSAIAASSITRPTTRDPVVYHHQSIRPERLDPALIPQHFDAAWSRIRGSGLHYAIGLTIAGLVVSTVPEVLRWRRKRAVFVGTSIMNSGCRLGIMILLGFVGGLVGILAGEFLLPIVAEERAALWPWAVFWFLLLADVATTIVAALMHRDLGRKAKSQGRPVPGA